MPSKYPNLEAAVRHLQENPDSVKAAVARRYGVPRGSLVRSFYKQRELSGHAGPRRPVLTEQEERVLCSYIDHLNGVGIPIRTTFVAEVATYLRRAKALASEPEPLALDNAWVHKLARRHHYEIQAQSKTTIERITQQDRQAAESHFERLRDMIAAEGAMPADMWTMERASLGTGRKSYETVITKNIGGALWTPSRQEPEEELSQMTLSPSLILSPGPSPNYTSPTQTSSSSSSSSSGETSSEPDQMPATIRRVHRAAHKIQKMLAEADDLEPELAQSVGRVIDDFVLSITDILKPKADEVGKMRSQSSIQIPDKENLRFAAA
ncbi:hypothetical protein GGR50DRAFT_398565 [Xylaria sp. CBS 124048]|nr:hypothetical protein GGR50DRAFT_398565 [Xylaria sp. CBS 124048]